MASRPVRFTAKLPVLLKEQTEWVKVPARLRPWLKEGVRVQGDYAIVPVAPYENPAVADVRRKLKRYRVAFTETEADGWVTFSTT
jgi:hypothetical protein